MGAVVHGALGDRFGLRWVTAGGAALFVAVLVVAGLARPDLVAALDDPPEGVGDNPARVPQDLLPR